MAKAIAKKVKDTSAKNGTLRIAVRTVKFVSFNILEGGVNIEHDIPYGDFGYTVNFIIDIDKKEKLAEVKTKATVVNKNTGEHLCSIETICGIYISNLEDVTSGVDENGLVSLEEPVARIIIGICVSTTRGMFAMSIANTPFKNAVIPVFDTKHVKPLAD